MSEEPFKNGDDIECVKTFQNGDVSSFEGILEKYEKPVINYVYRFFGDRELAEDLSQEVFLRIYRSLAEFVPRAKLSTWIFEIASNICIDYKRKRKIRLFSLSSLFGFNSDEEDNRTFDPPDSARPTAEQLSEKEQISRDVQAALLSLPDNQRIALTLKVYEDKTYQEIADILHCSIPAVESLLFRARRQLKEKIENTISSVV